MKKLQVKPKTKKKTSATNKGSNGKATSGRKSVKDLKPDRMKKAIAKAAKACKKKANIKEFPHKSEAL
ncbi:MAG: hypothetical protein AB2L13_07400 [Spirochaetota bacterium]